MRIFTASLATETNTFSPVPTDRASFEMAFYAGPGQHPDTPTLCSSPIVALSARAKQEGLTIIEGTATWAEPGGSEIDTGAILTTQASADLAGIHDRMPVVIRQEDFSRWLDCVNNEPSDVADLMGTPPAGLFEAVPVSDRVNDVANAGPDLQCRIEPAAASPEDRKEKPGSGQLELF